MTVAELLERISSRELAEWQAYYMLEPFGEERKDLRAGTISATVANIARGEQKPFQPSDFMPRFDQAEEPEGAEEIVTDAAEAEPSGPEAWRAQLEYIEALNAALGGADLRKLRKKTE